MPLCNRCWDHHPIDEKCKSGVQVEDASWTAYPDRGGYFAVIDGVLYVIPMLENGLMDASDPIEVDFDSIDPDDAAACRQIEAELKANTGKEV